MNLLLLEFNLFLLTPALQHSGQRSKICSIFLFLLTVHTRLWDNLLPVICCPQTLCRFNTAVHSYFTVKQVLETTLSAYLENRAHTEFERWTITNSLILAQSPCTTLCWLHVPRPSFSYSSKTLLFSCFSLTLPSAQAVQWQSYSNGIYFLQMSKAHAVYTITNCDYGDKNRSVSKVEGP